MSVTIFEYFIPIVFATTTQAKLSSFLIFQVIEDYKSLSLLDFFYTIINYGLEDKALTLFGGGGTTLSYKLKVAAAPSQLYKVPNQGS